MASHDKNDQMAVWPTSEFIVSMQARQGLVSGCTGAGQAGQERQSKMYFRTE